MQLPALMELAQYGGDWAVYCDAMYAFFLRAIANGNLRVNKLPVKCRFQPMSQGKAYTFWHIIQDGPDEDDRIPDLRRCERITWVPSIIKAGCKDPDVRWWKNARQGRKNLLLWAFDDDYVVILEFRSNRMMLVTSYGPLTKRRRKSFEAEWNAYHQNPW